MNKPDFIYGTAWKEDQTESLVRLALQAGFRAFDTANQRRHYLEAGTGAAVAGAIRDGLVRRDDLFLQTKFTYLDSQDHRLPYDPRSSPAEQVAQSFASSLEHLQVETIDCYVLHGPSQPRGLAPIDVEVWQAMEELHGSGRVRALGISNVAVDQIEDLLDVAQVTPAFVQNRCFARTGWDGAVRAYCRQHGITYQGFSLLTANVRELQNRAFWSIVNEVERTPAQVVFRFAIQSGILPLTGTSDPDHMRQDLHGLDFELSAQDLHVIETIGASRQAYDR